MATSERRRLLSNEDFHIKKEYSVDEDDDHDVVEKVEEAPICCSHRLLVIVCCTLSLTITYAAQASLSSALVCMIEDRDVHQGHSFIENVTSENETIYPFNVTASNETVGHNARWLFTWDKSKQGLAISTFFMGYYVSQIPASIAAARFGPKRVVVVSLILVSIFQALTVPAAYYGIGWLYADRIITGIIDGFLYAPTFALAGRWALRHETSLLFGIVGMGMELGNVLSYATSLLACEIDVQEGWPFVFYILGGLGLIVAFLFAIIVSDSPFTNRHISKKEVKFIASCIPKREPTPEEALVRVPVKEILSSVSVWAIVVSQIGSDWLYYFFVTMEPTFLKDVIKLTPAEVNLLSGLPFLGIIPTIYLSGYLCDKLVTKGIISNTKIRKINDFICKIIPSAILIGLGFMPQESTAVTFVLNLLGAMCMGFSYVSWMANPVDLAPAYTGFIVGICEIGAIWVAIVVPIVSDDITIDKTREEWQLVFYITAGIQVFCFLFYAFFASGELQPWALSSSKQAYDELDGQVGINQSLIEGGIKSKSNSKVSARKNQSTEDEAQNLLKSLSLSLGGFRGTSSYEASTRPDQDRRQQEVSSSTVVITGPAHTKSALLAGLTPMVGETGQYNLYHSASTDGLMRSVTLVKDGSGYFIPNGPLLITKPLPAKGSIEALGFESETYIESDDDSWQRAATRSLPSNLTRSVSHGRGDHDVHSIVFSPMASGQFDDKTSSDPSRNIKNLATEIAEALSVHSLNEQVGRVKDEINESNQGYKDKTVDNRKISKGLGKPQNFGKIPSEIKNLEGKKSYNIKDLMKQRRSSSHSKALRKKKSSFDAGNDPHLNSANTSSIMLSSEQYPDDVDIGDKESKRKNHKDPKQTSALRRFFSFGRSRSNLDLSLPKEETFVFVTNDDVKIASKVDSWVNKSFDSARSSRKSPNRKQNPRLESGVHQTTSRNTEDDEDVLFAHPSKKNKD